MRRFVYYFTLLAGLFSGVEAKAIPILDQSFEEEETNYIVSGGATFGQTFTVEITGILSSIEMKIGGDGNVSLGILPTISGTPVIGPALGSVEIENPQDYSSFTNINFSQFAIPVNAGDIFAIEMSGSSSTKGFRFSVENRSPLLYEGGQAWLRGGNTAPWYPLIVGSLGESDFHFRTFVEPSESVPEPSSMLLFSSGLVGYALLRKKLMG